MADDQHAQGRTQPEQQEPLLVLFIRVLVLDQDRPVVVEDRLRFLERDPVLPLVLGVLRLVPLEAEHRDALYLRCMAPPLAAQQELAAVDRPLWSVREPGRLASSSQGQSTTRAGSRS